MNRAIVGYNSNLMHFWTEFSDQSIFIVQFFSASTSACRLTPWSLNTWPCTVKMVPPSRTLCTTLSPLSDWLVPSIRKRPKSVFDQVEAAATLWSSNWANNAPSSGNSLALTLTTNQSGCTGSNSLSSECDYIFKLLYTNIKRVVW